MKPHIMNFDVGSTTNTISLTLEGSPIILIQNFYIDFHHLNELFIPYTLISM